MAVPELIQQQRHILHTLHKAVEQYQQQVAQAKERLERTLKQIQAEKVAAEQEAKQEYEQARDKYITTVLDAQLPMSGVNKEQRARIEQARGNLRAQLLSTTPVLTEARRINDITLVKSEIHGLGASNPKGLEPAKKRRLLIRIDGWLSLLLVFASLLGIRAAFSLFSGGEMGEVFLYISGCLSCDTQFESIY